MWTVKQNLQATIVHVVLFYVEIDSESRCGDLLEPYGFIDVQAGTIIRYRTSFPSAFFVEFVVMSGNKNLLSKFCGITIACRG